MECTSELHRDNLLTTCCALYLCHFKRVCIVRSVNLLTVTHRVEMRDMTLHRRRDSVHISLINLKEFKQISKTNLKEKTAPGCDIITGRVIKDPTEVSSKEASLSL